MIIYIRVKQSTLMALDECSYGESYYKTVGKCDTEL